MPTNSRIHKQILVYSLNGMKYINKIRDLQQYTFHKQHLNKRGQTQMSTNDSTYINLRTGQINLRCQKSGQYTLWGAGGQSVCLERDGCWLQENAVCENSSGYTLTCALESFDMYFLYSKAKMKLLQPENIPNISLKKNAV